MKAPIISVIMLTYNRENFIRRAIDSILNQTMSDFEFIIVDNGSTDSSGVIADKYAAQDSRISVIHRERGNIGSGRNAGISIATGDYVAFIDDDDYAELDFLEFLYKLAIENSADVSICGAIKWESGQEILVGINDAPFIMNAEEAVIELLWRKRYNNGFPTKLLSKTLFKGLSFPETGRYDDIYLMYKILANANKVISYGLPKYNIQRHENNNSAATTKYGMITSEYLDDYRTIYHERSNWLCERFPKNAHCWKYFDWSFQISMIEKISKYKLLECENHIEEMRRELTEYYDDFINSPYILDFEKEWMQIYVS